MKVLIGFFVDLGDKDLQIGLLNKLHVSLLYTTVLLSEGNEELCWRRVSLDIDLAEDVGLLKDVYLVLLVWNDLCVAIL